VATGRIHDHAGWRIHTDNLVRRKNLPHRYSYVWQKTKLERNDKMGLSQKLGMGQAIGQIAACMTTEYEFIMSGQTGTAWPVC
jgi:hypothetical protein